MYCIFYVKIKVLCIVCFFFLNASIQQISSSKFGFESGVILLFSRYLSSFILKINFTVTGLEIVRGGATFYTDTHTNRHTQTENTHTHPHIEAHFMSFFFFQKRNKTKNLMNIKSSKFFNVCVCVSMPTHCTITCFQFCTMRIDGVECGLFSIYALLGQTTLRMG